MNVFPPPLFDGFSSPSEDDIGTLFFAGKMDKNPSLEGC
jgi:hypothetical protein